MANKEVIVTILARGGTTADWAEVNPTPMRYTDTLTINGGGVS